MRVGLLAALALLSAPAALAADMFTGDWAGKGETLGTDDHFDMRIRIYADGSALVAYDSLNPASPYKCAGLLLPMESTPRARTFREKVTEGDCMDGSSVTLTLQAGKGMDWLWRGEDGGKAFTAKGALTLAR
jgi:hypothetical protein